MLSFAIYLVRVVASFVVTAIGSILLATVAFSEKRTAWTLGVSSAIVAAGILAWPRRPNSWRRDPPTDRQLSFARDLGIQSRKGMTKGELSDLISQAKEIRDAI